VNFPSLYFIFGLSIPFVTLGIKVAPQWWVTPSLIIGILLGGLTMLRGRFYYFTIFYFLFILYAALNIRMTSSLSAQALPLAALFGSSVCVISVGYIEKFGFRSFYNGFDWSFRIVLGLVLLDLSLQIAGLKELSDLVSLGVTGDHNRWIPYNSVGPFTRPYGPFPEPSMLGFYAFFSYIFFSLTEKKASSNRKNYALLLILLSMSMTGILAALIYRCLELVSFNRSAVRHDGLLSRSRFRSIGVAGFFVFPIVFFFSDITVNLLARFETVIAVLSNLSMMGSTGSRLLGGIYSIITFFKEGLVDLIFGLGWGLQEAWLQDLFGFLGHGSPLSSGNLYDKVSLIILSLGLMGLFLWLAILFLFFRAVKAERPVRVLLIIIVWVFSSGHISGYLDWQLLLVIGVGYLSRLNDKANGSLVNGNFRPKIT